jgi:hypothetical protein
VFALLDLLDLRDPGSLLLLRAGSLLDLRASSLLDLRDSGSVRVRSLLRQSLR